MKAIDTAKWLINHGCNRNSFRGNMKLQKMLYFSQLIHLAKYGEPLFDDNINAFEHGCVVEEVRKEYCKSYKELVADAECNPIELSQQQLDTLQTAMDIFGSKRAEVLEEINHTHTSWKKYFDNSDNDGYRVTEESVIPLDSLMNREVELMKTFLSYYGKDKIESAEGISTLLVKGVTFYYDPYEIEITNDVLQILESSDWQDTAYEIYMDENRGMVIY